MFFIERILKIMKKSKKAALLLAVMGLNSLPAVVDNGLMEGTFWSVNKAEAADSHGQYFANAQHQFSTAQIDDILSDFDGAPENITKKYFDEVIQKNIPGIEIYDYQGFTSAVDRANGYIGEIISRDGTTFVFSPYDVINRGSESEIRDSGEGAYEVGWYTGLRDGEYNKPRTAIGIDSTGKHLGRRTILSLQITARDMSSLMVKMLIHLVPIVFSVVNDASIHTITTAVKDIVVNHIEK